MAPLASNITLARVIAVCALVCCGVTGAPSANAQGIGSAGTLNSTQGAAPSFSTEQLDRSLRSQRRPPAALPGAAAKDQAIAPPSRVPSLMSPTDELFDAINRGDMPAVRDAISRGADLSATDELGLTPLDLSIDLGRNDVSFLLLSMRAAGSATAGGQGQAGRPAQAAMSETRTRPVRTKGMQRAEREHAPRAVTKAGDAEPAGEPSLPTLFARNGGTPIPRVGFLGFDGR